MHVRQVNIAGHENLQWIVEDITQRKKLETLRNDLTAMIYHDLRSPLSNIISSLEMLPSIAPDEFNPMLEPVLSITKRSTERMQRMIRSLLDINRLETGQRITDPAPILPRELLAEAVITVQPIAAHKKQTIQIQVNKDLPQIKVDADMIKRVLINLLGKRQ